MSTPAQRFESDRTKYPAMQIDEILVWRVWLAQHQHDYERWDYNTCIGIKKDPGPAFPQYIRDMAIKIRCLRVDAVGWQAETPTIFEVERRADGESLGQILAYSSVWQSDGLSTVPPRLAIVAAEVAPNVQPVFASHQIALYLVPGVNFSALSPGKLNP